MSSFCQTVTPNELVDRFWYSQETFHKNPFSQSQVVACRQVDRHDETKRSFLQLFFKMDIKRLKTRIHLTSRNVI